MSDNITKIAVLAETNQMYCPKCKCVYPGRFKAYSYFSFINDRDWHQGYVKYDRAGRREGIECECYKCGTGAHPICTNECADIVKELSGAGFEIISIIDRAGISLTGDISISLSKPLSIQFKVPQLAGITAPVKIGNPFGDNFTIEKLYDDVYELSSIKESGVNGELVAHTIKSSINEIKAKDWYETKCKDYAWSIKLKLDSIRDKDDKMPNRVIQSPSPLYSIYKHNCLFACITVYDHVFIKFIGEDKSFPDGVEVVLKSNGDIAIEFIRDFDVDATDKWLNTILERMDAYEPNN